MNQKKSPYRNLVLISQLGIQVMVPVFLCLAAGIFLDRRLSTGFTVPLLVLGILAGGRNAYLLAMSSVNEGKKQERETGNEKRK